MRKLEPYFWDFLEYNVPPLHQQDWDKLDVRHQEAAIHEHCGSAAQLHDIFIDVKVGLDYALRMARGSEQLTPGEKVALIDRTLSESKASAGMVGDRLGPDSDLVRVLKDTRRVLSIERANLAARRGAERVSNFETDGSLLGAGRIDAVSGDLAAQKLAGDTLFLNSGRPPSAQERPQQTALQVESTAPGSDSLRARESIRDDATRNLIAPETRVNAVSAKVADLRYSRAENAFIEREKSRMLGLAKFFNYWGFGSPEERLAVMHGVQDHCLADSSWCTERKAACRDRRPFFGDADCDGFDTMNTLHGR